MKVNPLVAETLQNYVQKFSFYHTKHTTNSHPEDRPVISLQANNLSLFSKLYYTCEYAM